MSIDFERYQFIKNKVQLKSVSLHELDCKRGTGKDKKLNLNIQQMSGDIFDENKIKIYLKVTMSFEQDGPFTLTCVHEGVCESDGSLEKDEFFGYVNDQIVPLLLPYARECIASTLVRMQVPPYTLPTIDVLQSMSLNHRSKNQE